LDAFALAENRIWVETAVSAGRVIGLFSLGAGAAIKALAGRAGRRLDDRWVWASRNPERSCLNPEAPDGNGLPECPSGPELFWDEVGTDLGKRDERVHWCFTSFREQILVPHYLYRHFRAEG
jgi:hypothetical protein